MIWPNRGADSGDTTIVVSSTLWLRAGDVVRLSDRRKFFVFYRVVSVVGTTMTVRRLGWKRTTMW